MLLTCMVAPRRAANQGVDKINGGRVHVEILAFCATSSIRRYVSRQLLRKGASQNLKR